MLKIRKLAPPCTWPVPMLAWDLEMQDVTSRMSRVCVDSNGCNNLECTQMFMHLSAFTDMECHTQSLDLSRHSLLKVTTAKNLL